jgi:PAS domain S-box-containing protein
VAGSNRTLAHSALIFCSLLAYILAFLLFEQVTNGAITALVIAPVGLLAWQRGWLAGLIAGLLSVIVNVLLFALVNPHWANVIIPLRSPGTLTVVLLGLGIGWVSQLLAQLRTQATLLAAEQETLRSHTLERSQAHAALYESEARFRGAFDSSPIGIALVAPHGRWLQVNPALCAIVGYTEAQLLATTFQVLTHPDDLDTDLAYVQRMLAGTIDAYQMEKRYIHKAGHFVRVLLNVSLVRDTRDQPCYFVSQVQDITARKQAEAELIETYSRNYALLEALPDTMYRIGVDGMLHDYKPGQVQDLAPPAALFLGSHVTNIFPPALARQIEEATLKVTTRGILQVIEYHSLVDGKIYDYEIRLVSSTNDEVLALVRDITERKAVERVTDELVAMVSHELRTPLTAIHGAMRLLAGGVAGALPSRAQTMAEIAVTNSDRLIRLINDLLDIQKMETGMVAMTRTPLALRPLLEQTLLSNQDYGRQYNVTFALDCPPQELIVAVDGDRLMQVCTNLLANAVKVSPAGGTVHVHVTAAAHVVRIAVIDHGPGIPEAFQAHVFEKFTQAKTSSTRQSGGSGLGLSIAKAIVEHLGGQIGFETTIGVGTTFSVELPIWTEDEVQSSVVAAQEGRLQEDRLRVTMLGSKA